MELGQHRHGRKEGSRRHEHAAWPEVTAALDLLPVPSLVLAPDGTALGANEAWAALAAAPSEVARGDGWLGAVDPLDREPLRGRLCEAAAAGQAGSADFQLADPAGGRWSRWWWRPGPAGHLLVCVADLDGHQPRHDDRWRLEHGPPPVLAQAVPPGAVTPADGQGSSGQTPAFLPCGPDAGTAAEAGLAGMVVHRLFGVGLTLQSAAGLADGLAAHRLGQAVARKLVQAVDELDAIIRDVRTAELKLHDPRCLRE